MDTKAPHLRRGEDAEAKALAFLTGQGLTPVEKNWRCRAGELDLIMRENDVLVFVEVRYRSDARFGGALESIDYRKQRRILAAARHYLQQHGEQPCRVDVVAFDPGKGGIQWLKNAISS